MPRRPGSLKRSQGTQSLLPKIAVFCEGKTEKDCLEKLRGYWRIPTVSVEVVGADDLDQFFSAGYTLTMPHFV
ncbi:MAG: hypothetical protein KAI47_14065 [Deltaproteobacteria bacterium]|nr:hypothetical protein [Deltaproteobacteria bacterium]